MFKCAHYFHATGTIALSDTQFLVLQRGSGVGFSPEVAVPPKTDPQTEVGGFFPLFPAERCSL